MEILSSITVLINLPNYFSIYARSNNIPEELPNVIDRVGEFIVEKFPSETSMVRYLVAQRQDSILKGFSFPRDPLHDELR